MQLISEEAIRLNGNRKFVHAYDRDGVEYFVSSDAFRDPFQQNMWGLAVLAKQGDSELMIHIPTFHISRKRGFSGKISKDIFNHIWDDPLQNACRYSKGFVRRFGKDMGLS